MGFGEGKYGSLLSVAAKLKDGEPYFLLRGQDALAASAIDAYANLLEGAAVTLEKEGDTDALRRAEELRQGAADVNEFANNLRKWQVDNEHIVKLPD
jgi:hypothetical protein